MKKNLNVLYKEIKEALKGGNIAEAKETYFEYKNRGGKRTVIALEVLKEETEAKTEASQAIEDGKSINDDNKKYLASLEKKSAEELDAERKVIAVNNVKSVEDLPKTEKVAKPRGRKPKATK